MVGVLNGQGWISWWDSSYVVDYSSCFAYHIRIGSCLEIRCLSCDLYFKRNQTLNCVLTLVMDLPLQIPCIDFDCSGWIKSFFLTNEEYYNSTMELSRNLAFHYGNLIQTSYHHETFCYFLNQLITGKNFIPLDWYLEFKYPCWNLEALVVAKLEPY